MPDDTTYHKMSISIMIFVWMRRNNNFYLSKRTIMEWMKMKVREECGTRQVYKIMLFILRPTWFCVHWYFTTTHHPRTFSPNLHTYTYTYMHNLLICVLFPSFCENIFAWMYKRSYLYTRARAVFFFRIVFPHFFLS